MKSFEQIIASTFCTFHTNEALSKNLVLFFMHFMLFLKTLTRINLFHSFQLLKEQRIPKIQPKQINPLSPMVERSFQETKRPENSTRDKTRLPPNN